MTTETVRLAAAQPDMNHRDPEFLRMVREVKQELRSLYAGGDDFDAFLIGGSGTAAVEAMVTSCVERGPVLVLENGYYSGRVKEKLTIHEIPHRTLSFDWLAPIDLAQVEAALKEERYEAIAMAHHETTSGRLNPVNEVARIAKSCGARLLVDAMSSFGADDLDLSHVDAVCASANKCLHGIPGVGFVLVRRDLAEQFGSYPRRSFYLSLPFYRGDEPPLTAPVPALAALRQALREMDGGQPAQRARYQDQSDQIRQILASYGLETATPPEEASCSLTVADLPPGWASGDWIAANRERGYLLYGCKGHLKERFFQVSVMGEVRDEHVNGWLAVFESLIRA
jgi:2-aminoethylphosphonate-pyruvate transaminase